MNDRLVRLFGLLTMILLAACTVPRGGSGDDDDDGEVDENPLPAFADDCFSQANDTLETAAGIPTENHWEMMDVRLCDDGDDVDYYRIDIPSQKWVSLKISIHGDGAGGDDLDLVEIDEDDEIVWASAASQDYERLAWYNPTSERWIRYVRVEGYNGAGSDYDILVRVASYHEGRDCDDSYPDESGDDGPCNRIMQFPQANYDEDGYFVYHEPHYSNLRREVAYLVRWAASEVKAEWPDADTLGLFDMSEDDGDTPGRMRNQLRHPEGTHTNGNDIDVSFYYNNGNSLAGYACSSHDQYFCTGPANLLDVPKTTLFLARLMDSPDVRVIGVDPAVAALVLDEADDLLEEGLITETSHDRLNYGFLAYGDGWPFHHHHLHFSWTWEGGFEGREVQTPPDGCLLQPELNPQAVAMPAL
jgi:hypothetical protein